MKVQVLNGAGEVKAEIEVDPARVYKMMGKWQYLDAIEAAILAVAEEEFEDVGIEEEGS